MHLLIHSCREELVPEEVVVNKGAAGYNVTKFQECDGRNLGLRTEAKRAVAVVQVLNKESTVELS